MWKIFLAICFQKLCLTNVVIKTVIKMSKSSLLKNIFGFCNLSPKLSSIIYAENVTFTQRFYRDFLCFQFQIITVTSKIFFFLSKNCVRGDFSIISRWQHLNTHLPLSLQKIGWKMWTVIRVELSLRSEYRHFIPQTQLKTSGLFRSYMS